MKDIVLSEVLKEKLQGQNLSALARKIGIPKTLLHDWVQSRRMPSLKNIRHVKTIADYLGLTLEEILLGEQPKNKKVLTSIVFKDDDKSYQISITKV